MPKVIARRKAFLTQFNNTVGYGNRFNIGHTEGKSTDTLKLG